MNYAIIVAGGEGSRIGGDIPKQFRTVGGKMMLLWSVEAFRKENPQTRILIVMHPGFFDLWDAETGALDEPWLSEIELVCGGRSRWESVKNGLMAIDAKEGDVVAVHDAARPFVTPELIRRGWAAAADSASNVPAVPVTDSLRHLTDDGSVAVARKEYVAVQTPQTFQAVALKDAYALPFDPDFTDDASVMEKAGHRTNIFDGDVNNFKVTNPNDLLLADLILSRKESEA